MLAAEIVTALQTIVSRELNPTDPAVVTVGSIHGGFKHNIIPASVKLQLTVRSYKPEVRAQILASIKRIATGLAVAAGLPETLMPKVEAAEEPVPATYNDPGLTATFQNVAMQSLGKEHVHQAMPVMMSEDFSFYGLTEPKIPSLIFWLGGGEPGRLARGEELPPNHSPMFAPDAKVAIPVGAKVMTDLAMNLFGSAKKEM